MNDESSYFEMVSAAGDGFPEHRIRRPLSDLVALERDLDEIAARAHSPELDFKKVWRNYNNGGKGTPTNASMRPEQKITEAEVRKRLGG